MRGLLIRAFFYLLACIPFFLMRIVGAVAGRFLWLMNTQSRQVTEINLAICFPHLDAAQREKLARRSLIETSTTALEIAGVWLWPLPRLKKLIKKVSGEHYLQEALEQSRGVILLTPHLGNWEVVGVYASQLCQLTVLYAPAKIEAMNALMVKGRTRNGYHLAPTNAQGVKTLLKALKNREVIGILPDQVPEQESGLFAPFFGEPALTMTLVANLAARTGATVICCYAKRLHHEAGFEICLRPAADNIASENLQEAVIALNQSVEACVRDCPELYQWEYKRFKRRPSGLPKLY